MPQFHIHTLGCKVNRAESETIAAALIDAGWTQCAAESADVAIVNTCTVTGEADTKNRKIIRGLLKAGAAHVIVDLRDCAGDLVPASALAILPILCDRDVAARAVLGDRRVWTIYSRANVERLVALLERAREAAPEAARGEAQGYIDEIRAKGAAVLKAKRATLDARERRAASELPEVVPSPFGDEIVRVVAPSARVTLLVGPRTGVGAERLADAVRGMARVRLVGAQTPGALDYDTMLTADYPDVGVRLTYPISRSDASHEGRGYALTGLPLDVRVPFTPEACVRDVTLVAALA